ncbi:MAG: metal ABC transporter permease [Armatimonadetes bacterium]|nr:metal ABC transporter permease [Armatimonadota bacterium]
MNPTLVVALVAVLAASACALAGVFLVLRKMGMMADAISHAILPGLVAGYVLAQGPSLIAGMLGATAAGLLTVVLVEAFAKSRRVKEDTAIGVVFPALFALGVFVISKYLANVHIDTDAVLFGEIAFAPFDTLEIGGRDYGSQSLWILGGLTLLNAAFMALFYKELKLSTFDPALAAALGFVPGLLHYGLMAMVAVTTVGALSAVGAILVVALLIVPSVTASLITYRLPVMIGLSVGIGILAALTGFGLAMVWDVSISGMIAAMLGVLFGIALLGSPTRGLIARAMRSRRRNQQFATEMLVVHLAHHEGTDDQAVESQIDHLHEGLDWQQEKIRRTVAHASDSGLVSERDGQLELTDSGRDLAGDVGSRRSGSGS